MQNLRSHDRDLTAQWVPVPRPYRPQPLVGSHAVRVALLTNSSGTAPRSSALVASLKSAGHRVSVAKLSKPRWRPERLTPVEHPLVGGADGLPPEVIWAETSRLIDAADRAAAQNRAWVARRPDWPAASRDHLLATPADPSLSVPVDRTTPERSPWDEHTGATPQGRHRGRVVVLAFRSTPSSPGHYLARALRRAGVEVRVTDRVVLDEHTDADAVLLVESPTPPIEVTGHSDVPIVFWVHHGEHHLDGNLRLAARYGADLVLMAHSWHLALRFTARVERFPFGVAPELIPPDAPAYAERPHDLAFVGSISGSAYERRRSLIAQARDSLDRVEVAEGISPLDMAALYGRSRSVLNEGGTRHRPITMRVFETIGAGALLVTEPAPGLELLFDGLYVTVNERGLEGEDLRSLLAGPEASAMAAAAHDHALTHHTYDHRVDLLFRLVDEVGAGGTPRAPAMKGDPVTTFLWDHPYGQRILDATGEVDAPGREVWRVSDLAHAPGPASFDTVVLGPDDPPELALAARRFVVGIGLDPDALGISPRRVSALGALTVIDLGAPGYDVDTVGGPPAVS